MSDVSQLFWDHLTSTSAAPMREMRKFSGLCLLILLIRLKSTAGSIINSETNEELLPTVAGLIDKDDSSKRVFCSGTIISENKILTAARCVKSE